MSATSVTKTTLSAAYVNQPLLLQYAVGRLITLQTRATLSSWLRRLQLRSMRYIILETQQANMYTEALISVCGAKHLYLDDLVKNLSVLKGTSH